MLHHKGYTGVVEFDDEADIFHGEVLHINDVITFQGSTVEELRRAFVESVEDYLAFCAARGEEPSKPFSGRLSCGFLPNCTAKCPRERAKAEQASIVLWRKPLRKNCAANALELRLKNWEALTTYFDYPPEVRRIICATNAIESLNSRVPRFSNAIA